MQVSIVREITNVILTLLVSNLYLMIQRELDSNYRIVLLVTILKSLIEFHKLNGNQSSKKSSMFRNKAIKRGLQVGKRTEDYAKKNDAVFQKPSL